MKPPGQHTSWGPGHPKAKLSTEQIDAIRDAYERGEGGYRRLAQRFSLHWQTVRGICTYRRRCRG